MLKRERDIWFKTLQNNTTSLQITDYGVGSKRLGNTRKISQLFRTSSSKGKYGWLLFKLAKHYQPATILELGTSLGVGTWHLHKGYTSSTIYTIEGCPETHAFASEQLNKFSCIHTICSTFDTFFANTPSSTFDLVFIDGHHSGSALLNYLERLQPFITEETLLVLDDIRWSKDMLTAWKSIIKSNDYHVTIDLFRMGIISRRKHQHKEHFILHY